MSNVKFGPREQLDDKLGEPWETLKLPYNGSHLDMLATLKELYADCLLQDMIFSSNPLLKLINKGDNNGKTKEVICSPSTRGNPKGVSDDLL